MCMDRICCFLSYFTVRRGQSVTRVQARYGGRRAALEAREACYEKIHTVEKEKWGLRECLAVEERVVRHITYIHCNSAGFNEKKFGLWMEKSMKHVIV